MQTFKDTEAREWLIRIDVNAIRRVRESYGVRLDKLFESQSDLAKFADDTCLFVDVLHCLCREQCDTRNITAEQFGQSLAGDAIESATNAFMEAIIEFLPPSKRRLMRQIADAQKACSAQAELRIQAAINNGLMTDLIHQELIKLDQVIQTARQPVSGT